MLWSYNISSFLLCYRTDRYTYFAYKYVCIQLCIYVFLIETKQVMLLGWPGCLQAHRVKCMWPDKQSPESYFACASRWGEMLCESTQDGLPANIALLLQHKKMLIKTKNKHRISSCQSILALVIFPHRQKKKKKAVFHCFAFLLMKCGPSQRCYNCLHITYIQHWSPNLGLCGFKQLGSLLLELFLGWMSPCCETTLFSHRQFY